MNAIVVNPLADLGRLYDRATLAAWTPPPPPDFVAWAQANISFGSESAFPGPFNLERFAYFRRPLEVLSPDDLSRVIAFMGSAQIGKTVYCQIFLGGSADLDPCQMICYHPTEGNAVEWARQKWRPMLKQSPRLRELFGEEKSRDGSQTMSYYERRDGAATLTIAGANSGPGVSMKSAKRQVQDDLAKWEILPSGDSEGQADSRSKAFLLAKILKASTPLVEPGCRITRAYLAGTQERWHIPCRACSQVQALEWENMETQLVPEHPEDAHFTCIGCGSEIRERDKFWMNANAVRGGGGWKAENPGARDPSFHIWAAYSPLESWENIARAWWKAKGIPSAEQTFFNDYLGRAYKGAGEAPPFESIRDRANKDGHRLGIIPYGGLYLTIGCDCQKNRVEAHIKAFGRDGRRWTIEYRVIEGHISEERCQEALDALLTETWPDEYGNARTIDKLAIDGNAWTDDVLKWTKRHSWNRVIATRGAKSETAPPLVPVQSERRPDGRKRKEQRRFYNLGVSGLKSSLYKALEKTDPHARGFCGYPKGLEDEFYRQLTAEKRVPIKTTDGSIEYRWKKDPSQANEVLDTELIAEGAAIRHGLRVLTDKAADEREAHLIASGAAAREAKSGAQLDMLDAGAAAERERLKEAPPSPEVKKTDRLAAKPLLDPERARDWLKR